MMSIESLTMMRDIRALEPDAAEATMNWAVQTLVRSVLEGQHTETDT